ncbi:Kinase [Hexamita inflata]|uniref:Kinase n=1 Tax=Hexamita inflata TaxID=28002 RepID=A0ABP1GDA4_9EUKA
MLQNFKILQNTTDIELLNKIGHGGFGQVYKCKYNDKIYACKVYNKKKIIESNQTPLIYNELRVLKKLQCTQSCVKFIDSLQDQNQLYIVLEYLESPCLKDLLKSQLLTEQQIRYVTRLLLKALQQMHALQIIYRDFKSEHIFFTADGIKLIDFGLSAEGQHRDTQCGTIQYQSPEIIQWWALELLF